MCLEVTREKCCQLEMDNVSNRFMCSASFILFMYNQLNNKIHMNICVYNMWSSVNVTVHGTLVDCLMCVTGVSSVCVCV